MNSVQENLISPSNQETKMAATTKITLRDLSRIAIFAAIIAALTFPGAIPLGTGVPITLQTLGVMLAGVVLGGYRGALAVTLYVILGLVGLPIFAEHSSGFAVLAGPSAGFLLGFIPGAFVTGLIAHAKSGKLSVLRTVLGSIIGGIAVVYAIGIPVMAANLKVDIFTATTYVTPFLTGDFIKVALTAIIAFGLHRAYPKAFKN
jgi:biotin transport system substrate-specific component